MPVTEESKYISDVLKGEAPGRRSRDNVTVLSGEVLSMGQVVGKDYKAITNFTQESGNNLTEGDVSLGSNAKKGTYTIIGTGADAGYMVDPDGYRVDDFQALSDTGEHLAIDSGSVADGDQYTVTVGDSSGKFVALDPSAVNGAQEAHGVALGEYDASEGDLPGVIVARDAEVVESGLVWPDSITTQEKETALAQMRSLGIVVREEV